MNTISLRLHRLISGATPPRPTADDALTEFESPISLDDEVSRNMLVATSPQVNPLSAAAGNSNDICGAAAIMNAVVLSSDTPATRSANARALRAAMTAIGARLPANLTAGDVEKALTALATGALRPTDVQVLQQAVYAMLLRVQGDTYRGANAPSMAIVLNQLAGDGAQLTGARFIMTNDAGLAHWVVETHGQVANSLPAQATPTRSRPKVDPSCPLWDSDVTVQSSGVTLRMRGPKRAPQSVDTTLEIDETHVTQSRELPVKLEAIDKRLRAALRSPSAAQQRQTQTRGWAAIARGENWRR